MFMKLIINKLQSKIIIVILALALFLRVYQLGTVPPSLSWDEVDVGYNAYTIANWFHDEWGNFLPLTFKSFGDYKRPVHIYSTAVSVKILGLSEFSTRLPMAIYGVFNVLLLYFLAKRIFKNKWVGILAALFLAISPFGLQFSRFNHEANVALFFFMLGVLTYFKGIEEKNYWLSFSFLGFGLSLLSYHSSTLVVPLLLFILLLFFIKQLWQLKKQALIGFVVFSLFLSLFLVDSNLLGLARLSQTSLPKEAIKNTNLYRQTHSDNLGFLELSFNRYLSYLTLNYLFISGDEIARHSIQTVGEFYKIDALFLLTGLIGILLKRKKESLFILAWVLTAPLPGSVSGGLTETAHAARGLFMMGSWHLISAYGCYIIFSLSKNKIYQRVFVTLVLAILVLSLKFYLEDYYGDYARRYAIEWQYGYKQIADYIDQHPNYSQVFITKERHQPYAFMLFYLKVPLPDYLASVNYNKSESYTYNLVSSFDQFHFGDWDPIQSMPSTGVLYILTPSEYDGLAHKKDFDVKKIVKYPNRTDAFYIVSAL